MLAQAISESFLAMYEEGREEVSKTILKQVFSQYPNVAYYGDLNLLHNLFMLKSIAQHRGQNDFKEFDRQLQVIAKKLLEDDESNPYANYYIADSFQLRSTEILRRSSCWILGFLDSWIGLIDSSSVSHKS